MLNEKEFMDDLSLKLDILKSLDDALEGKKYLYRGKFRNDGSIVFKVEHKKGNRENLITIRPKINFLEIQVYGKDRYEISKPNVFDPKMMAEIEEIYN